MKKSELRKRIATELIPDGNIYYNTKPDAWTYQEAMAEEIINFVEKAGLLPPATIRNEWESEDE